MTIKRAINCMAGIALNVAGACRICYGSVLAILACINQSGHENSLHCVETTTMYVFVSNSFFARVDPDCWAT